MAYREDKDLEFLGKMKSKDLDDLVYCLTHGDDGTARLTEELTYSDDYKKHYPNHSKYWEQIAGEIQCFGANSIATIFRGGKGVEYREILINVCHKMKVQFDTGQSTEQIEDNLLVKILENSIDKMNNQQLSEMAKLMGVKYSSNKDIPKSAMIQAFKIAFKSGGFKSYQLTVYIANAVMKTIFKRGLSLSANASLTKSMAIFTSPIGMAIGTAWTILDIASPAYRVTIPAVIQIAFLRKKYHADQPFWKKLTR